MSDEDDSVIVDIRQPRHYAKNGLYSMKETLIKRKEKNTRKPSASSIKKYSLPGNKPLAVKNLKRADFLLPCKLFSRSQEKERKRQRLAIKIDEKYRIISTDIRNRLHIESPPDDIRTVTDVDRNFYKFFNVRPSYNYAPLYKSFKFLLSSFMRVRQEVGYRRDNILNIEVNHKKELKTFNETAKKCTEQAKYFDNFISNDYEQSMVCLNKWNDLSTKVNNKISEMQCLAAEMFTTVSRLVGLDYLYGLQQKYGRFLYYLSPPSWRAKNREFARSVEIEAKGFDFGISSEDDTFTVIFEKMKKECSTALVKPVLYFSNAEDLMDIFYSIEKQQLYDFTQVEQVSPHARNLKDGIKMLKELIAQDSIGINNTIKYFEKLLNFDEERCNHLEAAFFKLVNGSFYKSVGAPEVLELQLHLDFCYEKVFSEKPINMDMVSAASALEKCYLDYSKRLDEMCGGNIKMAVLKCIEIERQKFKRANVAARELKNFSRLERELRRACEPMTNKYFSTIPVVTKKYENKGKSRPIKPKPADNHHSITEIEKEYLSLFTDWTENEDPANYLLSLNISEE